MKDFCDMTMAEFRAAQKNAYLAVWSESAKFMLSTSGYYYMCGDDPVDKWELFIDYYNRPRQLQMIVMGTHPKYSRMMKTNFDEIRCSQLQLGLLHETE